MNDNFLDIQILDTLEALAPVGLDSSRALHP